MSKPRASRIVLTDEEKKLCRQLLESKSTSDMIRRRVEIVVALDESDGICKTLSGVAKKLKIAESTVSYIEKMYQSIGLAELATTRRSRQPVSPELELKVVEAVIKDPPRGMTRWTTSSLAYYSEDLVGRHLPEWRIKTIVKRYDLKLRDYGVIRTYYKELSDTSGEKEFAEAAVSTVENGGHLYYPDLPALMEKYVGHPVGPKDVFEALIQQGVDLKLFLNPSWDVVWPGLDDEN